MGLKFLSFLLGKEIQGESMRSGGLFTPIIIITLAVLASSTAVITMRANSFWLTTCAGGFALVMVAHYVGSYHFFLRKNPDWLRGDDYNAVVAMRKGKVTETPRKNSKRSKRTTPIPKKAA